MIPADLRVLSAKDLFINQAAITGESLPVEKFTQPTNPKAHSPIELDNILFMGTNVISGTAIAVAVETGTRLFRRVGPAGEEAQREAERRQDQRHARRGGHRRRGVGERPGGDVESLARDELPGVGQPGGRLQGEQETEARPVQAERLHGDGTMEEVVVEAPEAGAPGGERPRHGAPSAQGWRSIHTRRVAAASGTSAARRR